MNHFGTLVSTQPVMTQELPLVHTSRCEFLDTIVASHKIASPKPCPVFHEYLVYLFYGRPAYRSTRGSRPGEGLALCPVCFVFKPRTVSKSICRVFPCDSGALSTDLFKPHLTVADLPELELEPVIESARRLVPFLFETNENYFVGKARVGVALGEDSPGQRFHQLLIGSGPSACDDRKSAIEVQVRDAVSLKGQLECVMLPREFLDDAKIRTAVLDEWKCDPLDYPTFYGAAPTEYYPVVRQQLFDRLMFSRPL